VSADPAAVGSTTPPPGGAQTVSLAEVLGALSYALDLTEGQPPAHTLRSCAMGMRLAQELHLDAETCSALYYALLLKDAGCSSNSAPTAELFGSDEHLVKRELKVTDWSRKHHAAQYVFRTAGEGCSLVGRLGYVLKVAKGPADSVNLFRIRCERGAGIARQLGFPELTASAIYALDEHWDGRGEPHGTRGEEIPLLARIANLAQTLDVFFRQGNAVRALSVIRSRSGTWFDPKLVELTRGWADDTDWWQVLAGPEVMSLVKAAEPDDRVRHIDGEALTGVCQAFAEIIDAKSPYTFRHSSGVAAYALQLGEQLGMSAGELQQLYRAALLHDIGKLGVSNRLLDKPGALTAEERGAVQLHAGYTFEILSRVAAFAGFAAVAAQHHERLDGTGYPWGLSGEALTLEARIMAVADVYEALTADRPYRAGMPSSKALQILEREAGSKVDAQCVEALTRTVT